MNTDHLFKILSALHPVSDDLRIAIEKELVLLSLPDHHYLVEAPKVSDHAYFLNSGCAMTYSFSHGRKLVEGFWLPGQIVFSPRSFLQQLPSYEFIQLMQDSELLCISHAGAQRLLRSYHDVVKIQQIILIQYYETERARVRDTYHLDTPTRHEKLLKRYPRIEQLFSQESIASYLGVTPQTLSRIKREGIP